jgi:hypothetical protein
MELYIEKEFLDKFYINFDSTNASRSQKAIASILSEYVEVKWFIDCDIDTIEQLDYLKNSNPFFSARANYSSPIPVKSIKEHFFEKSHCEQTLIFTQNEESWFEEAKIKGALCFNYNNYQIKIENLIAKCHFKIDLSEQFAGWENNLKELQQLFPINKIIINDSYLLDKPKFYERNLFPLIKSLSKNKKTLKYFFTDFFPKNGIFNREDIFDFIQNKYTSSEIKMIHNNVDGLNSHDRLLYSNFYIIDCAIGFNFNSNIKSNSQIIIETIFEKYTYNRLRNHLRAMEKHLHSLETEKKINLYYPI